MTAIQVNVGDHVFIDASEEEVGAVRQVARDHLVVYIENSGDFVVKGDQVKDVKAGKVILDSSTAPADLLKAARSAHTAEE